MVKFCINFFFLLFFIVIFQNSAFSEQAVYNKCFWPKKDAYGNKINFKKYLKEINLDQKKEDYVKDIVIRIDSEKYAIILTNVFNDGYEQKINFKIKEVKYPIIKGSTQRIVLSKGNLGLYLIEFDLSKRKAKILYEKQIEWNAVDKIYECSSYKADSNFVEKLREKSKVAKKQSVSPSKKKNNSKKFESIYGFTFELPVAYKLERRSDVEGINLNKEAKELVKEIKDIGTLQGIVEFYKINKSSNEGFTIQFLHVVDDLNQQKTEQDIKKDCSTVVEYWKSMGVIKKVYECKLINIPNNTKWSSFMEQSDAQGNSARMLATQFLKDNKVYQVMGRCLLSNCDKFRKDFFKLLETISF